MNEIKKIGNKTITFPKIIEYGQQIKVNEKTFCAMQIGYLKDQEDRTTPVYGWVEIFEKIDVENIEEKIDLKTLKNGDLVEFKNEEIYLVSAFTNFKGREKTKIYFRLFESSRCSEIYFDNGRHDHPIRDHDIVRILRK